MKTKMNRKMRRLALQANDAQRLGDTLYFSVPVELKAVAGEGNEKKPPTFDADVYAGGMMTPSVDGGPLTVVVDLAGLSIPPKPVPVLRDHDEGRVVGHATAKLDGSKLVASGTISGTGSDAAEVIGNAKNGFPWQLSMGCTIGRREYVAAGAVAVINGRSFSGPFVAIRAGRLREISFLSLGADDTTSARIAAKAAEEHAMTFEQWLKAMGFELADLNDAQKAGLKAKFEAEMKLQAKSAGSGSTSDSTAAAGPGDKKPEGAPAANQGSLQATAAKSGSDTVVVKPEELNDLRAKVADMERIDKIRDLFAGRHPELQAKAISEKWDVLKAELEIRMAELPSPPAAIIRSSDTGEAVLTAALCRSVGLKAETIEKSFKPQILEAVDRQFNRGLGVQQLLATAAAVAGRHVSPWDFRDTGKLQGILRAAFSNQNISGILSNVANKVLLEQYGFVEQAWREISAVGPVSDFKQITMYRLNTNGSFDKVAPTGELKHGKLEEQSYTNQADTYGMLIGISRKDLINDDLNALSGVPRALGRRAALKFNEVFWTAFMDNSSFFASGNSNVSTGGGSALGSAGLKAAVTVFDRQTDQDGKPLGAEAAVLLVPPELRETADELYVSTNINTGGAATTAKIGNANVYRGRYKPVTSRYLSNSSFTGYSTAAWYLLANPMDIASMHVVFLNGVQVPTIETADANFDTLGIQMRAYFDFGTSQHDYRAGVRSAGS